MKYLIIFALAHFGISAAAEMNLRTQPIGYLVPILNAELDIGVSESWTLGPTVAFLNHKYGDYQLTAGAVGIAGMYYISGKRFTDSWYINPAIQWESIKVTTTDPYYGDLSWTGTATVLSGIAGYQWFWESGFNITLGAGLSLSNLNKVELKDSSGTVRESYSRAGYTSAGLAIDFSLGYQF